MKVRYVAMDDGLIGVLCVCLVWLLYYMHRPWKRRLYIGLGLLLAGGTSNTLDRILFGHVRDYIVLLDRMAVNIADICVLIGVLLLATCVYRRSVFSTP